MAWSLPYTLLIIVLLAAPSIAARAIHAITGDPLWQYLAIDEERLAATEAEIVSDGPHIQIRVFWREADATYDAPEDLVTALRAAFEAKGIEAFVAVIRPASSSTRDDRPTTVAMRAGNNTFGPFPASDAARHIRPAVLAAHLAYEPEPTEEHRW